MKSVLVIGDLNDKLKDVLNKCIKESLILHYVNYEIYNEKHKKVNEEMQLTNSFLSNEQFCDMFISTTKDFENWIILKGDIHTKDFLHILIKFEKSFEPKKPDLFLSHIVEIVDNKGKSFYLSDGALNTKQIEDNSTFAKIAENAQLYILDKKQGISKINPTINTAIVLAADNENVPGYKTAESLVKYRYGQLMDRSHVEIKQFDECFSAKAWALKHKTEDVNAFSIPDLILTPDITVANCIWKSLTIISDCFAKGYVIGGKLTTVLLSRSDTEKSYYESIKSVC